MNRRLFACACVGLGLALMLAAPAFATVPAADKKTKLDPAKAIEAGLVWLARHQIPTGAWSPVLQKELCHPDGACVDPTVEWKEHYDVGVTGLCVLAFLRAGHTPSSKLEIGDAERGRFVGGKVVTDALEWLRKRQRLKGFFTKDRPFLYNESIATLAFAEATRAEKEGPWRAITERAVGCLLAAQKRNPSGSGLWGWRYAALFDVEEELKAQQGTSARSKDLTEADTSVTGWAMAALRAAMGVGITVPKTALDGGIDFLEYVSKTDGLVGYLTPEQAGMKVTGKNDEFDYHAGVMSALGMIILWDGSREPAHVFFEAAAKQIVKDLPKSSSKLSVDYYYWYYGSAALNAFDVPVKGKRKYADPWNKALIEASLAMQDKTKGACTFGGWTVLDRWAYTGGPLYCTAMNVLALEACTAAK